MASNLVYLGTAMLSVVSILFGPKRVTVVGIAVAIPVRIILKRIPF